VDTGKQTDGARLVNRKIEALLGLDDDSFKSAVLLPQGKFDQLLTAPGSERTRVLKSIFGVQALGSCASAPASTMTGSPS
jgi:DNA repair protein SbcC/Rad50